jgi:hypothetical protein
MATFLNFLSPTFSVLHPLLQVFPETLGVVIPPDVAVVAGVVAAVAGVPAVSEASEPGVVSVADLEVPEPGVVSVADLEVFEPGAVSVADLEVFEPGAVSVADLEVPEPRVVFVAVVSVADIVEPQASVDIALAFDVLVPVSVVAVEVDSSGRPRFLAFPNIDHFASSSSSVGVAGEESVHSSTGVRTNYSRCSIFSNLGLHHNKNLGHCYNKPNAHYNKVSDTNDHPMDATTSHSRKTGLHLYQEQRTHRSYQASLSHPEAPRIRWVAAERFQYLHLPLPLLE